MWLTFASFDWWSLVNLSSNIERVIFPVKEDAMYTLVSLREEDDRAMEAFLFYWMLIFFFSPHHPITSCPPRLKPLPGSLHFEEILLSESSSLSSAYRTGRSGDPFWSGSVSLVDDANLLGLFCEFGYNISFSLSKLSVLHFVDRHSNSSSLLPVCCGSVSCVLE